MKDSETNNYKILKSAFEQGRIYQYDSGITSSSPKSMNIKDFDSWCAEKFIDGSIDIMGIKTEPIKVIIDQSKEI